MKLLLIRHGQSMGNAEGRMQGRYDSPLTALGHRQACLLSARLQSEGRELAALYASPLRRATETAEILSASLALPVTMDERLAEYDIGLLTGILWADLERLHPEIWRQLHDTRGHVAYPGEEGMDAFQRRVAAVLEDFCARHGDDQAVGIVSHGGTLSMLVCAALGIPPRRPQPFRLSNASLSILEIWARGPVLTLLNDTHHLDGLGGRP